MAITADTYTHVLPVLALASIEARAAAIPRAIRAQDVPTVADADGSCGHFVPT